jgi:hypothetical protein
MAVKKVQNVCKDTNIEQKENIWHKNINLYFSLLGSFLSGAFVLDPEYIH